MTLVSFSIIRYTYTLMFSNKIIIAKGMNGEFITRQLCKQKSVEEEAKKSEVGKKALIKEERTERGYVRSRRIIIIIMHASVQKSCVYSCTCTVLSFAVMKTSVHTCYIVRIYVRITLLSSL